MCVLIERFGHADARAGDIGGRSDFKLISWPAQDRLLFVGGTTLTSAHTRNIWLSGFTGVNAWSEMPYNDASPWFSARSNQTLVIFHDNVVVMAGVSTIISSATTSTVVHNDVWVYANTQAVELVYAHTESSAPPTPKDGAYVPYWIRVTEHAPWLPRSGMSAVVFRGRLFILGGNDKNGRPIADLWVTRDLKEWTVLCTRTHIHTHTYTNTHTHTHTHTHTYDVCVLETCKTRHIMCTNIRYTMCVYIRDRQVKAHTRTHTLTHSLTLTHII